MSFYNFISLAGMAVLMILAWGFSNNRKSINWHVVVWGISLQFLFGWFFLVFPPGGKALYIINQLVVKVLDSSLAGAQFLFGPLALPPGTAGAHGEVSMGFIFAFQAFPSIIFFSALVSIFYFLNIIPIAIRFFAKLFTKLMGISGAESFCAASNIFVGIESALTIKPFLSRMTKSELCTVLSVCMATVASNVLGIYVFALKDIFPGIAGHLVTASLLSAPAALAVSKVLYPETGRPDTLGEDIKLEVDKPDGMFMAVIEGAQNGAKLIVGIAVLLIAVLGLLSLADQILMAAGEWVNSVAGIDFDWSFRNILGIMFFPLTLLIGVPFNEASAASVIIGERLIATEVVAYQHLAQAISNKTIVSARTMVVTSYALCGFAHITSVAIFVGGISAIVPERTKDLAEVSFRALCAATLACLLTACIAGLYFVDGTITLR